MFTAAVIFSVLIALMATISAVGKLTRMEKVIESLHSVGVPDNRIPVLAVLELAGAAGVILGIWVRPLGIAAATGLVLYFAGAIAAHVRVGDKEGMAGPLVPLLLSIAALVLRILAV